MIVVFLLRVEAELSTSSSITEVVFQYFLELDWSFFFSRGRRIVAAETPTTANPR